MNSDSGTAGTDTANGAPPRGGSTQQQQQQQQQQPPQLQFQSQINDLLELVSARARGEVSTGTVEAAVTRLLTSSSSSSSSAATAAQGGQARNGVRGATRSTSAATSAATGTAAARDHDGSTSSAAAAAAAAARQARVVVQDEDDYDYDDNDEDEEEKPPSTVAAADAAAAEVEVEAEAVGATAASKSRRGTKRKRPKRQSSIPAENDDDSNDEDYDPTEDNVSPEAAQADDDNGDDYEDDELRSKLLEQYELIPLGRQGAKMMVTFGDGRNPNPNAVEAALLGARRLIQHAIRDARALRRKQKAEYQKAQAAATLHTKRPKHISKDTVASLHATTVDSTLLFRAMKGHDPLGRSPGCGFEVSELESLFPEEMMAYQRWKRMQKAYSQSKEDRGDGKDGNALDEEDDEDGEKEEHEDGNGSSKNNTNNGAGTKVAGASDSRNKVDDHGGHLSRRLKQFDVRTDQMKEVWYLRFSEVRQGSFIDKATGVDGKLWRQAQKRRKQIKDRQGRNKGKTTWESLPAGCVAFLHWVGFDISSAMSPPNEATAHALAFLTYDFLGKIVEKAIFIRCLTQREEVRKTKRPGNSDDEGDDDFLLELRGKEQLTKEDIDKSLKDSTVVSEPLYGAASLGGNACKPQLYFGPGFEERLEMEMEEIMGNGKKEIPEEEVQIRQQEDELFAEMEKPPTKLESFIDIVSEEYITDEMQKKREASKATQREKRQRKSSDKKLKPKRGRKPGRKKK